MRLGVALPEVVEALPAQRTCVCAATHDCYGRHPGLCRRGNRAALWTVRHDALQDALYGVARAVGRVVHVWASQVEKWNPQHIVVLRNKKLKLT